MPRRHALSLATCTTLAGPTTHAQLIQEAALVLAGFPGVCPNTITAPAALSAVYGNDTLPAAMYVWNTAAMDSPTGCRLVQGIVPNVSAASSAGARNVFCTGYPPAPDDCLTANGDTASKYQLRADIGGAAWDPTAYSSFAFALATGLQIIFFVAAGPWGDYGAMRKTGMLICTIIGSLACIACLSITPSTVSAGAVLSVVINVTYGISFLLYNSYLPVLVGATAEVTGATGSADERRDEFQSTLDRWSAQGFALGYAAGFLCLIINLAVVIAAPDAVLAYRINCAIAGLWWCVDCEVSWFAALPLHDACASAPPQARLLHHLFHAGQATTRATTATRHQPRRPAVACPV